MNIFVPSVASVVKNPDSKYQAFRSDAHDKIVLAFELIAKDKPTIRDYEALTIAMQQGLCIARELERLAKGLPAQVTH